ncbi:MAG: exodeoxyribonuclease V subunit gamma, partial [Methanothrix sp.]|nr:exodeoxyribonuclease V subunit gamma [Methanothrix sp.]
ALLETAEVRDRFGIREADLELIREWVGRSGIRWGIDAEWKESLHLPRTSENTWAFGIERLLLGYAMPAGGRTAFASILGYDDMEGESVPVLGSFVTFLSTVFSQVRVIRESHTLEEWASVLNGLLDAFFLTGEGTADEERRIRSVIGRLTGSVSQSDRDAGQEMTPEDRRKSLLVSGVVIRLYFLQAVARIEEGRNFLSGGITFCEMLPMRSVPFEAVFILGMNHGDFPRMHSPSGFDLIARQPRKGDHNRRHQDLSLFLEAMLSSRRAFSVSYVGQGIRDNSPGPPSVVVSTLMDYLDGYGCADGIPVHELVTRKHSLQAFNPCYFTGKGPLFSYSAENAGAAGSLAGAAGSTRIFMPGDL